MCLTTTFTDANAMLGYCSLCRNMMMMMMMMTNEQIRSGAEAGSVVPAILPSSAAPARQPISRSYSPNRSLDGSRAIVHSVSACDSLAAGEACRSKNVRKGYPFVLRTFDKCGDNNHVES